LECRIYAEDPENSFFPSPGRITRLVQPAGPGIREDSGVYEGWTVPIDYDPMLSKLIAYAPTRELAITRMLRALDEYVIGGIRSNLSLFKRILRDPEFQAARIDTGYLDRLVAAENDLTAKSSVPDPAATVDGPEVPDLQVAAAAIFELLAEKPRAAVAASESERAWKAAALREALRP
jgi:acetyl-CoA carboxylase biotin carboxylase subunit